MRGKISDEKIFEGDPVHIGDGAACTVVRADAVGHPIAIGVMFSEGMLTGLPVPEEDLPLVASGGGTAAIDARLKVAQCTHYREKRGR